MENKIYTIRLTVVPQEITVTAANEGEAVMRARERFERLTNGLPTDTPHVLRAEAL